MDSDVKAWLLCEDVLTQIKDELVLEAVDILKKEKKEGRMSISGYVPAMPEKGGELEEDLFMINKVVENAKEMRSTWSRYLEDSGSDGSVPPSRIEELKKFLLAVDAIDLLMHTSNVFKKWADDTGRFQKTERPVDVIVESARGSKTRIEALGFVLSSSTFNGSNCPLKNDELSILKEGYSKLKNE